MLSKRTHDSLIPVYLGALCGESEAEARLTAEWVVHLQIDCSLFATVAVQSFNVCFALAAKFKSIHIDTLSSFICKAEHAQLGPGTFIKPTYLSSSHVSKLTDPA